MTDFAATRRLFALPPDLTYLDGNSLGPLPRAVPARVARVLEEEWGGELIRGWNSRGWMALSAAVGDRIGRLIGAEEGSVTVGDTLSVKVFQALSAALAMVPERRIVLSDSGNFPSDLYVADGLLRALGGGLELRVVAPEQVAEALDEEVAVLLLTEVDYRSARRHDMAGLTARAQAVGALTIWDLAHSAGAVPVDLAGAGADFAVGCTYKYLNGGPGAPAFLYVAPRHAGRAQPALQGWLGHEAPFAFDRDFRPAAGAAGFRIGTPPVLALAALDAALDAWEGVTSEALRSASIALTGHFIAEVERRCPSLELASPRDPEMRGSHVSFRHPHAYPLMQALIAAGVIGDVRAPDLLRFGFAPLYNDMADVVRAVAELERILGEGSWDRPVFHRRNGVT